MNISHSNPADFTPDVIFGADPLIVATGILCFAYIFIITEKINRAIIALLGGGLMVLTGVLNQEAAIRGIDFNTLALLAGMMGIVAITKRSGIFQYVAVLAAKSVKGNPRALLIVLPLITAVFSALLDNVTTVMLIVPITLLLCEQLKLKAYPYLVAQIFASNIGGTATLIGDPPNILIGSAVNLSFMDFVYNVGPATVILFVLTTIFFDVVYGRKLATTDKARAHLQNYNEKEAIKDVPLLIKSMFTLAMVLFGFTVGHHYGVQPGTTALFGAAFLLLLDNIGHSAEDQAHRVQDALSEIEWETIFFFLGLFILVYGVEVTGLLDILATELLAFTEGDLQLTGMVIIWVSAVASAIVDNIPFVATMIPLIESMGSSFGGDAGLMPLWWCLSLGACLGGNGSLIGASANVMVASYAERAGQRISFIKFLLLGFPLMIATVAVASVYAWFMFLTP